MRTSATGKADAGFTLVELLVALFVFSLGALALIKLDATSARTVAALEERQLARIEIANLSALLLTDPRAPSLGTVSGMSVNAGRRWRWTQRTELLEEGLVRIELGLSREDGQRLAQQTLVRAVQ